MLILKGLVVYLFLAPPVVLGALWVRGAWRTRDLNTALALGGVAGLSVHLVALNVLCHLIPPASAAWVLFAAEGLILAASARALFARDAFDGAASRDARTAWGWLAPVAILWIVQAHRVGITDPVFHSNVTGVMSGRTLPIPHPFDPAQLFLYHYGSDLLGTAVGGAVGMNPWWAMNSWIGLLAVLMLACAVEFVRAAASREGRAPCAREAAIVVLVFALGGGFSWLGWVAGDRRPFLLHEPGFAWDAVSSLFRTPSILTGWTWLFAIAAAVLRWPQADSAPSRPTALSSPALPFGVMLAALCLLALHAALVAGVALLVLTILWAARGRFSAGAPRLSDWVLAGVFAVLVAAFQGGPLTGALLGLPGSEQFVPRWTGRLWPTFPYSQSAAPDSPAYWRAMLRDYGPTAMLAPLLCLWVLIPRFDAPRAARIALFVSLPCLLMALYFEGAGTDMDMFRIGQLYVGAAMLSLGLLASRLWKPETTRLIRYSAAAILLILCVQGLRVTVLNAAVAFPNSPMSHEAGLAAALARVKERDGAREGVLAGIWVSPENPMPIAPAILGRPAPASAPSTNAICFRSPEWMAAFACPSPRNLRAARARWVCLAGEDLTRGLPVLEGCPAFEPHGAFGPPDALRYRLYRYAGLWELPENGLARARVLERFQIFGAKFDGRELSEPALLALTDGNPDTWVPLTAESLRTGGLLAVPVPQAGFPRRVSFVWLLGGNLGRCEFRVELLRSEAPGLSLHPPAREWRDVSAQVETILDLARPNAWGARLPESPAAAVRLTLLRAPEQLSAEIPCAEIYLGRAGFDAPLPASREELRLP